MSVSRSLRLATRGSRLALWQADHVAARLLALAPELRVERVVLQTGGDRGRDAASVVERGLFTRELERALSDGSVELAVHSLKDLPTRLAPGLALGAVLEREDPRDALIARPAGRLSDLRRGARVGTSSLRRRSQLLALRNDLEVVELRGNVPTRLERLDAGDCDAIVLARAGLRRLGLEDRIGELFEPRQMLPAAGQGALAVEMRDGDAELAALLSRLDHSATRRATAAERALLGALEGGCQVPVGALATFRERELTLAACVGELDGTRIVRMEGTARADDDSQARALGERVARELVAAGAGPVLERLRHAVAERASAGVLWEEA